MALSDLPANQGVMRQIVDELRLRPAHAYLLFGPRGSGKSLAARAFALSLLCEKEGGAEFCCNLIECPFRFVKQSRGRSSAPYGCSCCAGCLQVAHNSHPDFLVVCRQPERSEILIEQVRELIFRLALKPVRASRRIAIIDDAETLSPPAQQALLKTLEEPPGDALIFVVANNHRVLLPTVRSRLRPVWFRSVVDVIETTTDSAADAPRTLEHDRNRSAAEKLLAAVTNAKQITVLDARRLAEEFFRSREEAIEHFDWLARKLHEVVELKVLGDGAIKETCSRCEGYIRQISSTLSLPQVLAALELAIKTSDALSSMANPVLQAENWWISLGELAREKPAIS